MMASLYQSGSADEVRSGGCMCHSLISLLKEETRQPAFRRPPGIAHRVTRLDLQSVECFTLSPASFNLLPRLCAASLLLSATLSAASLALSAPSSILSFTLSLSIAIGTLLYNFRLTPVRVSSTTVRVSSTTSRTLVSPLRTVDPTA